MKWQLRNGKWISDKKMTEIRLRQADYYDGLLKHPSLGYYPDVNHRLADRIRNMSNREFGRHFGLIIKVKK